MKALLISDDADLRIHLRVALGNIERRTGERWRFLETSNGLQGIRTAWAERPDLVVTDEIVDGAGGFAITKDLRGQMEPFPGAVIIILARRQDAWLAEWAGADAWLTRPVDPFALADAAVSLVGAPQTVAGAAAPTTTGERVAD